VHDGVMELAIGQVLHRRTREVGNARIEMAAHRGAAAAVHAVAGGAVGKKLAAPGGEIRRGGLKWVGEEQVVSVPTARPRVAGAQRGFAARSA
jgi:hypothetical protein